MTENPAKSPRRISIAPMLDWTDRHFRYFFRGISRHAFLYSEMVTTGALLHGDVRRHLEFSAEEMPIALQLGGSEPLELAQCAKLAESWHYQEVNLNVGCPSERVQRGAFGACLMLEPKLVADCIKAMQDATTLPVTIKHRLGVDDAESYEALADFVSTIADVGCKIFVVHARNAILKGLSPKENREVPPLKYDFVYRLKRDFPDLEIILNGGVKTLADIDTHLEHVDGVMIGREAYHNPWFLHEADARYYSKSPPAVSRGAALRRMLPYVDAHLAAGGRIRDITRHLLGLMHGVAGGRFFRRMLSDPLALTDAHSDLLLKALNCCPSEARDIKDIWNDVFM